MKIAGLYLKPYKRLGLELLKLVEVPHKDSKANVCERVAICIFLCLYIPMPVFPSKTFPC